MENIKEYNKAFKIMCRAIRYFARIERKDNISVYIAGIGNILDVYDYTLFLIGDMMSSLKSNDFDMFNGYVKKFSLIVSENEKNNIFNKKSVNRNFFLIDPKGWKNFILESPNDKSFFWLLTGLGEIVLCCFTKEGVFQARVEDGLISSDKFMKRYNIDGCKWQPTEL